jgi:outer membrane protein
MNLRSEPNAPRRRLRRGRARSLRAPVALALALAPALFLFPALAAPLEGQTRLSLAEAERRALEFGEEVALVRERMAQAEDEITQVRAGAFPEISANLGYNRSIRSLFDSLVQDAPDPDNGGENPFADLPFGRANTWTAGVRGTQPLYAAGRVAIGLDIAAKVREILAAELAETEAEVRLQVREAYFQAAFAELLVEISDEAFELANDQLRQVEGFREQGIAAELDVLTARVERDNLEPQRVEARNARALARLNLLRLVQLPADAPVELVTPLEAELAGVDAEALREALEARRLLEAARTGVRIEEDQVRLARSGYRPTAGAFLDLGWQAFPATVFPGDATWREEWSAGFQVSIPIFNGFRTRAEVSAAHSGVRQAELELSQLREGLSLELESVLAEFESTRAQVEARGGTVEEARRLVELAELRFAAGSGTALELSNTRLLLQQARVNQAEALLRHVNALARLERATGGAISLVAERLNGYDAR